MMRLGLALLFASNAALAGQSPLPFDLGGDYELVNQNGDTHTQVDPKGKHQLLFFGYANCQQICSAALPLMADVTDMLARNGLDIQPVMITVDPARDTVEKIGPALIQHHPDFIGLTGSENALQVAYDAFSVEKEEIFFDPEYGPVYAHGSFLYLLDAEGEFLTVIPPIVAPEAAAKIISKYAGDPRS